MEERLIYLAKQYDLVVGDRFEMFYRGVIRSMNPYKYYIDVRCNKGNNYPRYYTFTPKPSDIGSFELTLSLYDDYHNLIESAKTTLNVYEKVRPNKALNVLCFGDSLTVNGVWPHTGYDRFINEGEKMDSTLLHFIGKMKKDEVGFEGYGGWKWSEFVTDDFVGIGSALWVYVKKHELDEHDQESIWESGGYEWILETIEKDRLKFKRGNGNFGCNKNVGEKFVNKSGGIHTEDIYFDHVEHEKSNPFYDANIKGPSFKYYCDKNGFEGIDLVYILLTWNGQYIPFNNDFSNHEKYIYTILKKIHEDYPLAHVRLIGIQSPSINGGITANYGCMGPYSDTFGEVSTAYNYDMYLEELSLKDEFKDYVTYLDMKASFDVEHSMPSIEAKVNKRSEVKELIGTNGVHPTMEGYLQIGDAFYRALVADINKFYK